ncbi:hypothetical protein ONZ45_g12123 [Pleurotus djamor]|nr:hypothetical protein ONZ45_g12123 [Pleurotus djamor]
MSDPLIQSVISLGFDLWAMKLYWVSVSSLWVYDYFLTLEMEVKYAWAGRKTPVFWLFILNRYLAPVFIITHSLGDFLASFDSNPKLSWLYVLQGSKSVLFSASAVILCQWAIILYAVAQPSKATSQIAVLLPPELTLELPPLPTIDPFHVCLIMSTLPNGASLVEAFLYLSLTFDSVAFICILGVTISAARDHYFTELFRVLQRDGVIYFFVLFSSNLTWLLLALYGRPGLKALHNQ